MEVVGWTTRAIFKGNNYHIVRLGIYCDDIGAYSYDDGFMECNGMAFPLEGNSMPGNNYTCLDGYACEGTCNNGVDFHDLAIWSDLVYIPKQCLQSLTGDDIPSYDQHTPEPTEYLYTAKFSAEWSLNRDAFAVTADCSGSSPVINITCVNGRIQLIEKIFPTVDCSQVGSSVLECTDSGQSFIGNSSGNFSGAIYVSTHLSSE
jgi:hypothetical protein